MDKRAHLPLFLLLLLAWAGSAHAQSDSTTGGKPARTPSPLTERGRIMPSGTLGGYWSNDAASSYGSYPTWSLYAYPAVTYFLRDNLGLGAGLDLGWSRGDFYRGGEFKRYELGASVMFTWNVPISARWSLMLRPAVGYTREWSDETTRSSLPSDLGPGSSLPANLGDGSSLALVESTVSYLRFSTSLPFVYAFTSQVGLGFGPQLRVDYMLDREVTAGLTASEAPPSSLVSQLPIRLSARGTRVQLGLSLSFLASF